MPETRSDHLTTMSSLKLIAEGLAATDFGLGVALGLKNVADSDHPKAISTALIGSLSTLSGDMSIVVGSASLVVGAIGLSVSGSLALIRHIQNERKHE
jgi:hypothetical protein